MTKGRLEAFSDGVLAIVITIMVLELKTPHGKGWNDLLPLWPIALSYVLSFIYVGIYWNNHHHMMHAVSKVRGSVLWANLHLLFWLSLTPFVTAWAGETMFAPIPVAVYGMMLLMAGVAYYILSRVLIASEGKDSKFAQAVGKDVKGITSLVLYAVGIVCAFSWPTVSCTLYVVVALMWLVPDPRVERHMA